MTVFDELWARERDDDGACGTRRYWSALRKISLRLTVTYASCSRVSPRLSEELHKRSLRGDQVATSCSSVREGSKQHACAAGTFVIIQVRGTRCAKPTPTSAAVRPEYRLTRRTSEELAAHGLTADEIALSLGISPSTLYAKKSTSNIRTAHRDAHTFSIMRLIDQTYSGSQSL